MSMIDKMIYFNTNKTFKKAIKTTLADHLPNNTISTFSNDIWKKFKEQSSTLQKQKTMGATVMVRYSLFTLLIYEKLISENIEKTKAMALSSQITWIIYDHITNKFWRFTRIFSKKPIKRVKKAMNFFINHFPYKSPGYEMQILKTNENEVAFNVYKCPAAEFFKEKNLSDLCTMSWCNLDYPLANRWNVDLERDKTIAKDYELCNFKFLAKD